MLSRWIPRGATLGAIGMLLATLAACGDKHQPGPPPAPPGSSALVQPLSFEPPVEATETGRIAALARAYQPVLVVARADRFWPVPVGVLSRIQHGATGVCLHDITCPNALTSLDQLKPTGDRQGYLLYPASLTNAEEEFEDAAHALGIGDDAISHWMTLGSADPSAKAEEYFFYSRFSPQTDPRLPPNLITLEYWFFYPFNYLPVSLKAAQKLGTDPVAATRFNLDYHQGDFEHVDVLLDPETQRPRYVYMARHSGENVAYDWDSPDLTRVAATDWLTHDLRQPTHSGTHPLVLAGFGGHASYARCGRQPRALSIKFHGISTGVRVYDYTICPDPLASDAQAPVGPVLRFGPGTPLVALRPDSWACWPGLFGRQLLPRDQSSLKGKVGREQNGPEAPLRQGENKGHFCPGA